MTTDEIKKGVNSSLQWYETLHGDLSMLRHGAADLLSGYADWTLWDFLQGIYFDIGQIVDLLKGLQQTLTAWGNRWDSQDLYLMEWAKRWDSLDKSPADLSETNKLLGRLTADVASIRDKYVLEDALSSILNVLVGDLQTPQTQASPLWSMLFFSALSSRMQPRPSGSSILRALPLWSIFPIMVSLPKSAVGLSLFSLLRRCFSTPGVSSTAWAGVSSNGHFHF